MRLRKSSGMGMKRMKNRRIVRNVNETLEVLPNVQGTKNKAMFGVGGTRKEKKGQKSRQERRPEREAIFVHSH